MFYEIDQNNSYGVFDVTDTLCHRLFIEADSVEQATAKAEELGCYWDGVSNGVDCPCCGDRWYQPISPLDMTKITGNGYSVYVFGTEREWWKKFGGYEVVKKPQADITYGFTMTTGSVRFHNIEEYAQYLADAHGWTTPDARIYYADGKVVEIHKSKK